jgi:hypothetical protein
MAVAVAAADSRISAERTDLSRAIRTGAIWGIMGAVVMAVYAMVAGLTYLNAGFFTPLYHIASSVIDPAAMMASMEKAMMGANDFYFDLGPAAVGMGVHLLVGAIYGVIFALIARALRLDRASAVAAGALYGIVVLLVSSFVGLPLAAAALGGGDPIRDMPRMVGWTTFTIEHVLFGVVLGIGWMIHVRSRSAAAQLLLSLQPGKESESKS